MNTRRLAAVSLALALSGASGWSVAAGPSQPATHDGGSSMMGGGMMSGGMMGHCPMMGQLPPLLDHRQRIIRTADVMRFLAEAQPCNSLPRLLRPSACLSCVCLLHICCIVIKVQATTCLLRSWEQSHGCRLSGRSRTMARSPTMAAVANRYLLIRDCGCGSCDVSLRGAR